MKYEDLYKHINECFLAVRKAQCFSCKQIFKTKNDEKEIKDHIDSCPIIKMLKFGQKIDAATLRAEKKKIFLQNDLQKSILNFDIKVWETETDLDILAKKILNVELDGMVWQEDYHIIPIAFSICKLNMSCIIEDDKVTSDDVIYYLQESFEDEIQNIDIYSLSKYS